MMMMWGLHVLGLVRIECLCSRSATDLLPIVNADGVELSWLGRGRRGDRVGWGGVG